MNQHLPKVRIVTPMPDHVGITRAIFNTVTVDGREWPIVDYAVRGSVDGVQQVTLTFVADLTIEQRPPKGNK